MAAVQRRETRTNDGDERIRQPVVLGAEPLGFVEDRLRLLTTAELEEVDGEEGSECRAKAAFSELSEGVPTEPVHRLSRLEIAREVQPPPSVLALRARAVLVAALDQS